MKRSERVLFHSSQNGRRNWERTSHRMEGRKKAKLSSQCSVSLSAFTFYETIKHIFQFNLVIFSVRVIIYLVAMQLFTLREQTLGNAFYLYIFFFS